MAKVIKNTHKKADADDFLCFFWSTFAVETVSKFFPKTRIICRQIRKHLGGKGQVDKLVVYRRDLSCAAFMWGNLTCMTNIYVLSPSTF